MIRALVQHDGVIGTVIFNRFLLKGWETGHPKEAATVETVVTAIDHVCQLAGDARHAGIGTDFDGGFGMKSAPAISTRWPICTSSPRRWRSVVIRQPTELIERELLESVEERKGEEVGWTLETKNASTSNR
jgi:microsomal dipeptidase-like Zn-dependent dipeptidase